MKKNPPSIDDIRQIWKQGVQTAPIASANVFAAALAAVDRGSEDIVGVDYIWGAAVSMVINIILCLSVSEWGGVVMDSDITSFFLTDFITEALYG